MYSPAITHRLELRKEAPPRTEAEPSFGNSPPGVSRVQPQAAGYNTARVQYPAMLLLANHGPSKIVVSRQTIKSGYFISDFMVNCCNFMPLKNLTMYISLFLEVSSIYI